MNNANTGFLINHFITDHSCRYILYFYTVSGFKTVVFWVFVALALGAGIYAYFNLKSNKKPNVDALSVIPDNCLVYLNTNNFFELNKKINSQSLIADKLKLFGDVNDFCNTLRAFDSLFMSNELLKEEIEGNLIHFAYYEENPGWLAAFNIKQLGNEEVIKNSLSETLKATKTDGENYEFSIHKGTTYYFNLNSGIIVISSSKEQVSRALTKSDLKLETNKAYLEFKNTLSENSLLSIFVNHLLYSDSKIVSVLNLSYASKKGYSAGVIDFQPSQIKINGFLNPDSTELISFFRDQEPQETADVITYLPWNTVSFKAYGFSSYPTLRKKLGTTGDISGFWKTRNEKALYNLEKEFNENLIHHLIDFRTASRDRFLSMEIQDTLKATEQLKIMSDSVLFLNSYTVYQLVKDSMAPSLKLVEPLFNAKTDYAAVYQSHLFFSESAEKLAQVLDDLKHERMLSKDESFVIYKNQHFVDDYNYLVYASPNQGKEALNPFFNFKKKTAEDPFANFKHLSFSISHHRKQFKFRFQLMNESESRTKNRNVLWTLNLDTTAIMTAGNFVNHNTDENELVIQDDRNTLYLINAKGTVLWRKKLNEKILSPINRVDIYKKEKYQMLFNTKNYLHLIDRNGNYVEGYPVKLPAQATSALAVFDYDGDKDYRLLIACKNNFIYNYSIHGTRQEKFSPVKTENEVNLPAQYVKVGQSDYLVALDKEGKIYTFSRKGIGRIGLRNRTVAGCQAFYADAGNTINSTHLVYIDDKNGLINKISFSDKKEIVKLNSEIENASVNFSMVDDNRGMDLILTKNNTIQAYNFSGNLIVEKISEIPLSRTDFYNDESHSLFYALSEDRSEVVVFDELKQKTKRLKASALPLVSDLFKDNKKYLIITHGKQLSCVLLN